MSAAVPLLRRATFEDLLAIPEHERFHEIIDGEIIPLAAPSFDHGSAQTKLAAHIDPYNRRPGGRHPGGWWFGSDVDIELERHQVYRPDIAGWRRDRLPERPRSMPVRVRPDWVCEILSSSNERYDLGPKLRAYHRIGVDHYWILDPRRQTLLVHRWAPDGYVVALDARRGDRVRAEPLDLLELQVGSLFGDDEDEPAGA